MVIRKAIALEKDTLIVIDKIKCDLCGTCVGVCPENVITMTINNLIIDDNGCTRCCKCIWICPVDALTLSPKRSVVQKSIIT